ncbi:hypothetical protein PISL3812_06996 [Talaromyces islandicus]|uniref:Uncharacterized protein n=1 Tax=Talaromyces islandicus TaxID=28573 RepID=A0A0U1M4J7_TALIS|nr:hypothetical protein PISL3812_06996 [Talaromyces islandicus]
MRFRMQKQKILATTALFIGRTFAANATTPSASGCVDWATMSSCLAEAETSLATCIAASGGSDDVVVACGWQDDINKMLCYQSSCWNKAYSCEYQYLVSYYKVQRTVDEKIPFYPAPDNAPGGCSCNLGEVETNATASLNKVESCSNYTGSLDATDLLTCQCCAWSASVSAFYGICPNTSLDGLGIISFAASVASYEQFSGSCAGLTSEKCLKYDIGSADNGKYIDPASLPAGGSQSLSTTAGPSSLTSPPAGATVTWSALNQTFTVTAAAYKAQDVTSGASTSAAPATATTGTVGGSGSGSTATATTGSAAAATTTGGASVSETQRSMWALVILALVVGLV